MTNLKTAIENISAGRAWNVGAEEQEQRDKVTHLAEVERLAKEDLLNKETQRNDITLRLKNILNEYCTGEGFNIKSIDSFKNGAMGLIITVTLDTGLQRVIKISYDYNGTDINEYTIQEEVNNISSEISPIVYFFQMIKSSDLKEILICIKQLYHLGDLIIPVTWFGILEDFFKPESDNELRLENVHFSMIMMDYIEGISFYEATGGKKMEEIDGLLEDLRLKINLLHENGIYHCDLHNDNVVVDGNKAKIIDFGWATKDPGGTPQWNEEGKCTIENPPSQVQDTLHMMCGLRAGPDWNGEGSCLLDR